MAIGGRSFGSTGFHKLAAGRRSVAPWKREMRSNLKLLRFQDLEREMHVGGICERVGMRERSDVTKREMKSARYLYVVYPGFLDSFFDG